MRHTFLVVTVKKWLKSVYIYGSYCKIKQESPAAARKPRDAAAIPVSFHCHVVAFLFPVPMFRPSPPQVCSMSGWVHVVRNASKMTTVLLPVLERKPML